MKVQLPTGGLRVTQSDISRLVPVIVVGNDTARIESREIVGPAKASSEPAAPRGQAPRGEAAALGQGAETWPGFATPADQVDHSRHRVRAVERALGTADHLHM